MGRLDLSGDLLDDADELEIDDDVKAVHPEVIKGNTRRMVEDRLEELRLQKQINDFDFDI